MHIAETGLSRASSRRRARALAQNEPRAAHHTHGGGSGQGRIAGVTSHLSAQNALQRAPLLLRGGSVRRPAAGEGVRLGHRCDCAHGGMVTMIPSTPRPRRRNRPGSHASPTPTRIRVAKRNRRTARRCRGGAVRINLHTRTLLVFPAIAQLTLGAPEVCSQAAASGRTA
jgi:hypothetical protein